MKGVGNHIGIRKKTSAAAEEEETAVEETGAKVEAVPEDILLKHILNFGVWKLKSDTSTPEKIFMIEPKMMKYLLRGTPTDGLDKSPVFLPINYIPENLGTLGWGAEAAKHIPMERHQKEVGNFYGEDFSFDEYKYEAKEGETQDALFKQSEWYSEYEKTLSTKKGGQSKNTTAKKNKSKRNKSKKNK